MYANQVRQLFLSGTPLGKTNKLYIPLLNTNAPMVGDDVLPTTTLYDVAKLGDSLITYDNPMFTPGDDKYSSMVNDYLCSVQLVSLIAHIQTRVNFTKVRAENAFESWQQAKVEGSEQSRRRRPGSV
jgi:hypothetical protein